MADAEFATAKYRRRYKELVDDANDWRSQWSDISDYMLPRKGRYLKDENEETNSGRKKHQKIINGSTKDALRIVAAGLQGGLTSPSRPWFNLALPDKELTEFGPVKEWLHGVRDSMLNVFARSNFYGSVHSLYKELAAFGTGSMLIEEDFSSVIRCRPFTIGEAVYALDEKYRGNTLYRRTSFTARQIVRKFGEANVSEAVKSAVENGKGDSRFDVIHAIQPNDDFDPQKPTSDSLVFESVSFELKNSPEKFLRKGGYRSKPMVIVRWDVTGVDTYGGCPGMDALGDAMMLQKMEEKKLKALDKMVDPPMNAPVSLKAKGGTIIAGGVNYVDTQQGQQGFVPAYQVNPDIQNIGVEIANVEQRIRRFFFNDLFLSLIGTSKQMTATEVAERHEEKLLMLGPAIERFQQELLDPAIDRTFVIMDSLGLIPPAPPELADAPIKVEYISLLAQAQKLVGTATVDQLAGFVANAAQVNPEVIDKMNFDEAVDEYGDLLGAAPRLIRTDEEVFVLREQRTQAQQAQQLAEQAKTAAEGAKDLGQADIGDGKTALQMIIDGAA